MGQLTGIRPKYLGVPSCAYKIGSYTIEKNGTLVVPETMVEQEIIRTLISDDIIFGEVPAAETSIAATEEQETALAPAKAPIVYAEVSKREDSETVEALTTSLPMRKHTGGTLRNLIFLIHSRGPLLSKPPTISRYADVVCCDACGTVEALECANPAEKKPLTK